MSKQQQQQRALECLDIQQTARGYVARVCHKQQQQPAQTINKPNDQTSSAYGFALCVYILHSQFISVLIYILKAIPSSKYATQLMESARAALVQMCQARACCSHMH